MALSGLPQVGCDAYPLGQEGCLGLKDHAESGARQGEVGQVDRTEKSGILQFASFSEFCHFLLRDLVCILLDLYLSISLGGVLI